MFSFHFVIETRLWVGYLFWIFVTSLPISIATYVAYQWVFHPRHSVPGSKSASLSRLWLFWQFRTWQFPQTILALHRRYGPVVRIAPNEVSVADPGALQTIFGTYNKGYWYRGLGAQDFGLLNEMDMERAKFQRKLFYPPISNTSIIESEAHMKAPLDTLLDKLRTMEGKSIDIVQWTSMITLDLLTSIVYGESFASLEHGSDGGLYDELTTQWRLKDSWNLFPIITKYAKAIEAFIRRTSLSISPTALLLNRCAELNHHRLNTPPSLSSTPDLLSKYILSFHQKPHFPPHWLNPVIPHILLAGHDATAGSLPAQILYILSHHHVKKKVQDEITQAELAGLLSNPMMSDEIKHLPHLEACLEEGFRLFGAVGHLSRVVPKAGIVIGDFYLPGGTTIYVSPLVLAHSPEVYGPDPSIYRPERWFQATPFERALMRSTNLAFSAGLRVCPGRGLGMSIIIKTVVTLLRDLDMNIVEVGQEQGRNEGMGWEWESYWAVRVKDGVRVEVRPRRGKKGSVINLFQGTRDHVHKWP